MKSDLELEANYKDFFKFYLPKRYKTERFEDLRPQKIPPWSKDRFILKFSRFYSKDFRELYNQYFKAGIEYLEGLPAKEAGSPYNLSSNVVYGIAKDILAGKNMINIFNSRIGYRGKIGLDRAMAEIRIYHFINKKVPFSTTKKIKNIIAAISKGYWEEYGINSWDTMIKYIFGEKQLKIWEETIRKQKYEKAKSELSRFKERCGRLPTNFDKELSWIRGRATSGYWRIFGIKTWNDILMLTFNEINCPMNIYTGIKGLNHAKKELKKYYEEKGKLPIQMDLLNISRAATRGNWHEYGIKKWNDILIHTFGKANVIMEDYLEKGSLDRVKKKLFNFKNENGRYPNLNDREMKPIAEAARRGCFNYQGITSWNQLVKETFGRINRENNKYVGKKGLMRVIEELKNIKEKNKKIPRQKDVSKGIIVALRRGEWSKQEIKSWNDLLLYVFGRTRAFTRTVKIINNVKIIQFQYLGKEGLDEAIQRIKEFKNKYGRKPTSWDKEMKGIVGAIGRGNWKDFKIESWNDLLIHIFGELNKTHLNYVGKEGLEKAKKILEEFKIKNKRLPTMRDKEISTVLSTIRCGKWRSFGIEKWNDIILYVFGAINKSYGKFKGEKGLSNAISVLKDFEKNHNRIPILKDSGMSGIRKALSRREWSKFGIDVWSDLKKHVF